VSTSKALRVLQRHRILAAIGLIAIVGCTPDQEQTFGDQLSSIASSLIDQLVVFGGDFLRSLLAAFLQ